MAKPPIVEKQGPPLTLEYRPLGGNRAEVDAFAFADYLKESLAALRHTAELLAGRKVHLHYTLSGLQKQSPALVEVTPRVPVAEIPLISEAQEKHIHTIQELQSGKIPAFLDFPALQIYQRLGTIAKKHRFVAEVRVNRASVVAGADLKDRLDLELLKDQWVYGTIRGWLRAYYAARGHRLIRLYPRSGPPLVCHFRPSQKEKVRELIETFVEAAGRMRYRPNSYHPDYMEIDKISSYGADAAPTFREMDGFVPDPAEGPASEDLVREMRDEW